MLVANGKGLTGGSGITSQFWHCGAVLEFVMVCAEVMEAKTRAENRSDLDRSHMSVDRK